MSEQQEKTPTGEHQESTTETTTTTTATNNTSEHQQHSAASNSQADNGSQQSEPPKGSGHELSGSSTPDSTATQASGSEVSPASTSQDVAALAKSVSQGSSDVPASSAPSSPSSAKMDQQEEGGSQHQSRSSQHHSRQSSAAAGGGKSATGASHSPSPSTSPMRQSRRKRMKLGELDINTAKIGFLGAGKMTESTISGLIHYAKIQPGNIHVAAPSSKGLERFKALGCRVTKRNYDIFGRYDCDIIFLCFHGYVIKHCYKQGGSRPHPLTTNYIPHQRHPIYILSMVSGVSLSQIKACLLNPESGSRYVLEIHRIMMNTAVGHGLGICAVDCEPDSKRLSAPIRQLLSSVAQLEHVPASQMDAACAIGGSGLAFSYYFINSLADGAFKMGLSRQQAIRFASKTAQCAAQTMLESGKHPAELRDNVSSPSGAAIYGVHVLERNDVASGVTAAVEAAHKRANDLANQETPAQ